MVLFFDVFLVLRKTYMLDTPLFNFPDYYNPNNTYTHRDTNIQSNNVIDTIVRDSAKVTLVSI